MQEQLIQLQSKVTDITYNPFINLIDQIKAAKLLIAKQSGFSAELERLDLALEELDTLEVLPHGDLERIKGFNKIKNRVLKVIKETLVKL